MDYSETLMRAMLADLPDGEGSFEDFCDGDGIPDTTDGADAPFWIRLAIHKTGDRIAIDFAGSDPQVKGPMNAPLSVTASGVFCGLKMAVDPNSLIPPNSGCRRTIESRRRRAPWFRRVSRPSSTPTTRSPPRRRYGTARSRPLAHPVMACSQGTRPFSRSGGVDPLGSTPRPQRR
jgi:N-methylhydantoinase B/oxoprolinase/acetone carboxylase alpha subunit